jgi:hypothetical protein
LLVQLDDPVPRLDANVVAARAQASQPRESRALQWAAGFVVALVIAGAGYAAYATPGSPVRAWVTSLASRFGGHRADAPEADRSAAGISVAPGRELVIVFASPQPEGGVRVSLVDGAEVAVHAPIGAATFTSDAERLVIDNHGALATFEIEIPRAAPRVEIRVSGRRVFLKDGPRVTTSASTDSVAPYWLPLSPE